MSNPFLPYPAIVVCWRQEGCPACEQFSPVFRAIAKRYERCIPSALIDCTDGPLATWSDAYRVRHTPTVMVIRHGRPSLRRLEGAVPPEQLELFYAYAVRGLECHL